MDEYINKEVLIQTLKDNTTEMESDIYYGSNMGIPEDEIENIVNEVPIEDVVKVVRCKDCIYFKSKNSKGTQGICLCGEKEMNYGGEFYSFANDFCSYGERKEMKDNDRK